MTDDGTDALEQALALHATPGRLPIFLDLPLPGGVLLLIRIAAGDAEAIAGALPRSGKSQQLVTEAAVLYIQQILFHEGADSYCLLGVASDADMASVKEHYRWLMRWLHPDRHPDRWEVVYSERVNRAWNSLNSEQRRSDYDAQAKAIAPVRAGSQGVRRHAARRNAKHPLAQPLLSPRVVHRMPALVLGGLTIMAAIALATFGLLQRDEHEASSGTQETRRPTADETAAQEAAIRRQVALEEHEIELSQPVQPNPQTIARENALRAPIVGGSNPPAIAADASPQALTADPVAGTVAEPIPLSTTAPATFAVQQNREALPTVMPGSTPVHTARGEPSALSTRNLAPARRSAPASALVMPTPAPIGREPVRASLRPTPDSNAQTNPVAPAAPAITKSTSTPAHAASPVASAAEHPQSAVSLPQHVRVQAAVLPAPTSPDVMAPAVHVAATPMPTLVARTAMSAEVATKLLPLIFEDAYAKGDLIQMMRLFAPSASNNRGGIEAIRQDYDHLFRASVSRRLNLEELKWTVLPDRIAGSGAFEAQVRQGDDQAGKRVRGWIQIEAVPINGDWKIQRLLHRNTE